jgi:hypothetical protein
VTHNIIGIKGEKVKKIFQYFGLFGGMRSKSHHQSVRTRGFAFGIRIRDGLAVHGAKKTGNDILAVGKWGQVPKFIRQRQILDSRHSEKSPTQRAGKVI